MTREKQFTGCIYTYVARQLFKSVKEIKDKPFHKRQKKIIPGTIGASFRTSKSMLMLTWRLNYDDVVITSITV